MKAVIFDLDGTLIDSLPAIQQAFDEVSDALDLPRADRQTAQGFVGGGVPVAITRMLAWADADPGLHQRAVEVMLEAYDKVPTSANKVYPGMRDALDGLVRTGLPMGLCTNKPEAPTLQIVDAMALGPFSVILGGDSLPTRKPDPAPLLEVANRLKVDPADALYVGDSEIDHATAAAAQMPFALFEGGYLNRPLRAPNPVVRFSDWTQFQDRVAPFQADQSQS